MYADMTGQEKNNKRQVIIYGGCGRYVCNPSSWKVEAGELRTSKAVSAMPKVEAGMD